MAITWSRSRANWFDDAAGGTPIREVDLDNIEAGILALYQVVNGKGDLLVATAADTLERLGPGSNGQVLTADSAEATGLKWTNVIAATIFDAKGDIIAASAADTAARLAVGNNGRVLHAASGESTGLQWKFVSTPAFHAFCSTTQAILANTETKVQLDTEDLDSDGLFDAGTNRRFTANRAGWYLIYAMVTVNDINDGLRLIMRVKKNTTIVLEPIETSGGAQPLSAFGCRLIHFNGTTDFVETYVEINGAESLLAGTDSTFMGGHFVYET